MLWNRGLETGLAIGKDGLIMIMTRYVQWQVLDSVPTPLPPKYMSAIFGERLRAKTGSHFRPWETLFFYLRGPRISFQPDLHIVFEDATFLTQ